MSDTIRTLEPDSGFGSNRAANDRLVTLLEGKYRDEKVVNIERWDSPAQPQTGWLMVTGEATTEG